VSALATADVELMRLEGVGVAYPQRGAWFRRSVYWALQDISFSIRQGECLGIIGRNGVGKTTLLRLLSNIIGEDRGSVWRAAGLRTALLSIQAGFIHSLTGRENAVMSGITLGLPKRRIEERLNEVIEFAELREFIDQPVGSYSSGMRARLGFAVAVQVDPDLLLIDEAISVGDEPFRKKSSAVINDRVHSKKTTVLVTHNAQLVKTLCTRAVWIEKGVVRMIGSPDQIVDGYLAA
jgi:lipopolysaccharide transport system ATP-binding protein